MHVRHTDHNRAGGRQPPERTGRRWRQDRFSDAAIFLALYSALTKSPLAQDIAMTGEVSVQGAVRNLTPAPGWHEAISTVLD